VSTPSRGEIWLAQLDPVTEHEHAGTRPVLIVSHDGLNHGPARIAVAVPLTTRSRRMPLRVAIGPPEGGLQQPSFAICEGVRSISTERLIRRFGRVTPDTLTRVADRLRVVLEL
jgi:mRNA interferase MazF